MKRIVIPAGVRSTEWRNLAAWTRYNLSMGRYFVYILASYTRVLYVGVTNNLERRVYEHKNKLIEGYTQRYDVHRLVYYEETVDVKSALEREKQLKCCRREKKLHLIESMNADWQDLSESWQGSDSAGWSQ